MKTKRRSALLLFVGLACGLSAQMFGDNVAAASAVEAASDAFEKRVSGRAASLVGRLQLADESVALKVQAALTRFYRELNAAHALRDSRLGALAAPELLQIGHIHFETEKQIHAVQGELMGSLASLLEDTQLEAIKNGMTFDMVPLSLATYARMFPAMTERQRAQLFAWLVDAREEALTAGSAEAKLDVFRANKARMHAYLSAQSFDVDAALKQEEARKAAGKKAD